MSTNGKTSWGRKGLWIGALAALAVAAIAYVAIGTRSPSPEEAAGSIAGVQKAEKHRDIQVGEGDVNLEDPEVQEILQNDEFLRLLEDPEARRILASQEFANILALQAAERAVFAHAAFQKAAFDQNAANLLALQEMRSLLASAQWRALMKNDVARAAFGSKQAAILFSSPQVREVFSKGQASIVFKSFESMKEAFAHNRELVAFLGEHRALLAFLGEAPAAALFNSPRALQALALGENRAALVSQSMVNLTQVANLRAFLNSPAANMLGQARFIKFLQSPVALRVFSHPQVARIMASQRASHAFMSANTRNMIAQGQFTQSR